MLSSHVSGPFGQRVGSGSVRGFTLIELLIAVGIVGILAAIAYPSYQSQIRKTRRADAQAVLMQGAQFMERGYTENGAYSVTGFPYSKSPIDGGDTYYAISAQLVARASGRNGFTITATPQASEVGAGNLTLDETGARTGW